MDVLEVCPTVDAIRAFLEYLVDRLLQEDNSTNDDLPQSQHEKDANQVHLVVLLKNCCHKKLNQELAKFQPSLLSDPYRILSFRDPLSLTSI
ncbi:hypothetical protein MTR_2g098780 [Medicago truncatula]|uniref:DUF7913 domain-containing protein n=1 Tax=Medicago truncatula TaxID=3880 RepID=G7IHT7_MEDTR|nr:hypothetical protein MTR_2g098780 [Medicago truncatula]